MSKEKIAQLRKHVSPFEKADIKASVRQMINTILPFLVLWFLAYQALKLSVFLAIPWRSSPLDSSSGCSLSSMTVHTVHSSRIRRRMHRRNDHRDFDVISV